VVLFSLIYRFLRYGDDPGFYLLQARDTVRWLDDSGMLRKGMTVLDLGCGHGFIGGELKKKGCRVVFADEKNEVVTEYGQVEYRHFEIGKDELGSLGTYDLVICSNVLEHIDDPWKLIGSLHRVLEPGGRLYLSWTNWLSPWGGHDFSPFHYLGARRGVKVYDRLIGRKRSHTPYVTLFPTSIAGILKMVRRNPHLRIVRVLPRYYPRLEFTTRVPLLREFLTFNCLVLAGRSGPDSDGRGHSDCR
jgi:2-polyprenyl-3-methyl-5-hydroxy-6-metoxy-1,4-benzoquinol methylase